MLKINFNVLQRLSPELPELTIESITSRVLDTLYSFYAKNCNSFNFESKNNNLSTMPDFFDFSNFKDLTLQMIKLTQVYLQMTKPILTDDPI